jgi:hypothetical protein
VKKERKNAAHLGRITVGADRISVTYRNGWLRFRKVRSRGRVEALALEDVYQLARNQKSFGFMP